MFPRFRQHPLAGEHITKTLPSYSSCSDAPDARLSAEVCDVLVDKMGTAIGRESDRGHMAADDMLEELHSASTSAWCSGGTAPEESPVNIND